MRARNCEKNCPGCTTRCHRLTLSDYLPEEKFNLTNKQRKEIWNAIKSNRPILFLGSASTGKSYIAQKLREYGIAAFAPEMVSTIFLGNELPRKKKLITSLTSLGIN